MPIDKEFHDLATLLFRKHGDRALIYALKNAQMAGSGNAELNVVWTRVAKMIECLMSEARPERRHSGV